MAMQSQDEVFAELVDAMEPRIPMVTMMFDRPTVGKPAHTIDVTVRLQDNITCAELGEYNIDPVSALLLVGKAGRYAIDGELCDESIDFITELYHIVNARYAHVLSEYQDTQLKADPVSCSLADAVQFVLDAHKRVNGRQLVVTIDGAHWSVL